LIKPINKVLTFFYVNNNDKFILVAVCVSFEPTSLWHKFKKNILKLYKCSMYVLLCIKKKDKSKKIKKKKSPYIFKKKVKKTFLI